MTVTELQASPNESDGAGIPLVPFDPAEQLQKQATESIEYQAILAKATVVSEVPVNCWNAMVFTVVNDFPDLVAMHSTWVQANRILFAIVMFVLNLLIQGTILFFIYKQLMMPSFLSAQNLYKNFHEEAYESGRFSLHHFEKMSGEDQGDICGLALSHVLICRILLFLWVSTNILEISSCLKRITILFWLPRLPAQLDTRLMVKDVKHQEAAEEFWIICADLRTKMFLVVIVYIPKLFVAFVLTATGCLWLLASESFGDLILNSLALAFVTDVDEMLAAAFFPNELSREIDALSYASQEREDATDEKKNAAREANSYMWQLFILSLSCAIVVGIHKFQQVLPGFGEDVSSACEAYWKSMSPWCLPFEENCFPTG